MKLAPIYSIFVFTFLAFLLQGISSTNSSPLALTFTTVADAYVNESSPSKNYGTSTTLQVDGSPKIRSFLRFDVKGFSGTVTKATLRVYATTASSQGYKVRSVNDNSWNETTINYNNAPSVGSAMDSSGAFNASSWTEVDVSSFVRGPGVFSLALTLKSGDLIRFASRESGSNKPQLIIETNSSNPTATRTPTVRPGTPTRTPTSPPGGSTAVILAAGDIASCNRTGDEATAKLLDNLQGTVLTLGDNAYPDGTAQNFNDCYHPSWGRHKGRTRPSPGNHDYHVSGAAGYFGYFGSAAGDPSKGYYSFNLGDWHLIALNSEIDLSTGSTQEKWLRADLAANPKNCTLAYWHKPRFSSGPHGSNANMKPLWQALYDYNADVVLGGHDHDYERFAPQKPDGTADATRGIREFVVGTGGNGHYSPSNVQPNSQVRNGDTYGVLKMTLRANSYDWQFVPEAGKSFTDSGSTNCH